MDKERSGPAEPLKPAPVETRLGNLKSCPAESKRQPVIGELQSGQVKPAQKVRIAEIKSGPVQPERNVKLTEVKREEGEKGLSINAETIKWFEDRITDADTKFTEIKNDIKEGNKNYVEKGIKLVDSLIYLSGEIDKYANEILSRIENLRSVRKEVYELKDLFDQLVEQHSRIQLLKSQLLNNEAISNAYEEKDKIKKIKEKSKEAIISGFFEEATKALEKTILSKFKDLKDWEQKDNEYQKLLNSLQKVLNKSIQQLRKTKNLSPRVSDKYFLEEFDKIKPSLFEMISYNNIKRKRGDIEQLDRLGQESYILQCKFIARFTDDAKALAREFTDKFNQYKEQINSEVIDTLSKDGQKSLDTTWKSLEFDIPIDIVRKIRDYLKEELKTLYTQQYHQVNTPFKEKLTDPPKFDKNVADYIADEFLRHE